MFVDNGSGSHMPAVSTGDLCKTAVLSQSESIVKPSESDDSFFNAWLSSPSQQQEAKHSPSASRSPLASKHHQTSEQVRSARLKESKSLSSTATEDAAASCKHNLNRGTSSEQFTIKSDQKLATHSQLQPISVNVSDDEIVQPENTNVTGLLISTTAFEMAKTSSSKPNESDENVPVFDARTNVVPDTNVALLVSSSNDDSTDNYTGRLSAEVDASASLGCFNSEMSSSILSPQPDELLGIDDDIPPPESGWNEMVESDVWLASSVDLTKVERGDISTANSRTELADEVKVEGGVECDVVDGKDSDRHEMPSDLSQDMASTLSTVVDSKVGKEVSPFEGVMKDISSLEGSLEASADEMSESNKTVVAEDSDVYCDDTDVDEMQMSGGARSGIQQEHSVSVLSSDLCHTSADGSDTVDHGLSSGPDAGCDNDDCNEASSPSSRSVKNLLEEAMADGSSRDTTGLTEPTRIESGGNSGHTSTDEIDTTTSSDIEVISHTSSVNGQAAGTHSSRPVDISPTRHGGNVWNYRTPYSAVSGQHRRSDSGSSAQSLQSRTDEDFASPEADHGRDYLSRLSRDSRRYVSKSDTGHY